MVLTDHFFILSSTIKRKKDLDKMVFFKNYARFNSSMQSEIIDEQSI